MIVVGYSSKAEGRAALDRAIAEATLRGAELIVVHTAPDCDLEASCGPSWRASGVPHEVRAAADGPRPGRGAAQRRRGEPAPSSS